MGLADIANDSRTVVAAFAALIALVSACVSIYANWRSRKLSETSVRIAEFNAAQSHRKALFDWASACQDAFADTYALLQFGTSDSLEWVQQAKTSLTKLTSLIDKGRWLLPNVDHEKYGTNKQAAYTGLRQLPLDCLVDAYNTLLAGMKQLQASDSTGGDGSRDGSASFKMSDAAKQIMLLKREFTSAIQEKLEPRIVEDEIKNLKAKAKK